MKNFGVMMTSSLIDLKITSMIIFLQNNFPIDVSRDVYGLIRRL